MSDRLFSIGLAPDHDHCDHDAGRCEATGETWHQETLDTAADAAGEESK